MGIRTWNGYSGYENKASESYIETLERFCSECHTNEGYKGCENCSTGIFLKQLRDYLLSASESDILKDQAKLLRKLKKIIKSLSNLSPCYPVDLDELKKVSFVLDLWEEAFYKISQCEMFKLEVKKLVKKNGIGAIGKWQNEN